MADFGLSEMESLLVRTRQALDSMAARRGDTDTGDGHRGRGEALVGPVRAVVADGRLESLRMEPSVMRMTPQKMCDHIVLAVNAAFEDCQGRQASAPTAAQVAPQALAPQLLELQEGSLRQMRVFGAAMEDVLTRMRQTRADIG